MRHKTFHMAGVYPADHVAATTELEMQPNVQNEVYAHLHRAGWSLGIYSPAGQMNGW